MHGCLHAVSVTSGGVSDSRGRVSKVSGCLRGVELSQLLSLLVSSDVVDCCLRGMELSQLMSLPDGHVLVYATMSTVQCCLFTE